MLIPPFFINCVAALGNVRPIPRPGGEQPQNKWVTTGTGFFYGYLVKHHEDHTKREYRVFLVTAKHVIQSHIDKGFDIRVRINSEDPNTPVLDFELPRALGPDHWFPHPKDDIDVAVIGLNLDFLKQHNITPSFFTSDGTAANRAKLKAREVATGDGIFVLGFPMGLTGEQRNYVIVRQGCIARISEMLDGAAPDFLVDAPAYPGNSGGPVILRPEFVAIEGTKNQGDAALLGLVKSYLPYEDIAISLQTNQPRISFQENSGLALILPTDFIDETIEALIARFPSASPPAPEIILPVEDGGNVQFK
jgi:Trypsin-like peptidase domain